MSELFKPAAPAAELDPDLFEPPRWPGGPPICHYENLPAFEDEKALGKYHAENCSGCHLVMKWQCAKCGCWHFHADGMAPSGTTSGTSRQAPEFVPRYKKKWSES